MKPTVQQTMQPRQIATIAITVLVSCWVLFGIDKDTHKFADLFKPVNLAALVVYFTPTFAICLVLFRTFSKKHNPVSSVTRSLVIGIPMGFLVVISLFLLYLRR